LDRLRWKLLCEYGAPEKRNSKGDTNVEQTPQEIHVVILV
jgi:hypothetical protein